MRKAFSFMIGITIGVMVGGIFALLFAPESGNSLRVKLQDHSSGFLDEIRAAVSERRKALEGRLAELSNPYASDED